MSNHWFFFKVEGQNYPCEIFSDVFKVSAKNVARSGEKCRLEFHTTFKQISESII